MPSKIYGAGNDAPLKIGLIGCGGRGTGAAGEALKADKNVTLTAMGDAFEEVEIARNVDEPLVEIAFNARYVIDVRGEERREAPGRWDGCVNERSRCPSAVAASESQSS